MMLRDRYEYVIEAFTPTPPLRRDLGYPPRLALA